VSIIEVFVEKSNFSLLFPRNIGISEYRNIGISEYRNIGISEYRNIGISEYRNIGISEYRNIGISEYRNIGISEYRNKSSFYIRVVKRKFWGYSCFDDEYLCHIGRIFFCFIFFPRNPIHRFSHKVFSFFFLLRRLRQQGGKPFKRFLLFHVFMKYDSFRIHSLFFTTFDAFFLENRIIAFFSIRFFVLYFWYC